MTYYDLERIMELHRHEHFATWTEEELAEYELLKSKLEQKLEKWDKCHDVLNGKTNQSFVEWYDESQENKQALEKIDNYISSKMYSNDERFNKFRDKIKLTALG